MFTMRNDNTVAAAATAELTHEQSENESRYKCVCTECVLRSHHPLPCCQRKRVENQNANVCVCVKRMYILCARIECMYN